MKRMNTKSRWHVLAYLVGITVSVLSKGLVALALDAVTSIWELPDQIVTYWYRKGPIFLVATLLILFGLDHMLFPHCTLIYLDIHILRHFIPMAVPG
jgi:hypothetical protein